MIIPSYRRRYFGQLGIWRFGDWAIKAYGISVHSPETDGQFLDVSLMEEAQAYVSGNLGRMDETPHYSVGFAILHHGSGAKSLLTQWWANECVCLQHVAQSEYSGPVEFKPANQDLMACAYELVAIDFERRAWISTVMSSKSRRITSVTCFQTGFTSGRPLLADGHMPTVRCLQREQQRANSSHCRTS